MLVRSIYALTGVAMPCACIGFAISGAVPAVHAPWQSGEMWVFTSLLLSWPAISALLPLILLSMFCMTAIIIRPSLRQFALIRFGIYAGSPMAAVCLALFLASLGTFGLIAAVVVGLTLLFLLLLISSVAKYWRRFSIRHLMGLTALTALAASVGHYLDWTQDVSDVLGSAAVLSLAATPVLNWVAYTWAAIWLYRQPYENTLSPTSWALAAFTLVVAWWHSWRVAVEIMLGEYSRLPTTNPNCYVSAAAAHGHTQLVGSFCVHGDREHTLVNVQMQRLKFLELCLLAAWPKGHAAARTFYDFYGPDLAQFCRRNVWFADLTFLLLSPIEWMAELIRRAARVPSSSLDRLYR